MKRTLRWLLLLIPLAGGGLALWRKLVQPLEVRAARIVRGPAIATVFATGWIEPKERRLLRPPRAGIVERIFAKEGDEVRAGEPLLRLRDTARDVRKERVQAEIDRLEADLSPQSALRTAAQARIDEAKANETWALSEVERSRPLVEEGLLAQRLLDQMIAGREAAGQRVRTLTDELAHSIADLETRRRQAQAELETLLASERDDLLAAPFDGVVLARFAEEGESVNPERDLLKFGDVRDLIVEGEVDEEDVARVAAGQEVLVRVSGDESALVHGRIAELFPDSNKATRSYRVRVSFPGSSFQPDGPLGLRGSTRSRSGRKLLPGSSCELGIVVDQRADVVVFPRVALTTRSTVFVLEGGRARERRIEVGLKNFDRCEAVAGLQEDELVALERIGELRDGRRVVVTETITSGPPAAPAVVDLDGRPVDPLSSDAPATVLLFTRTDCPISNKYAPEVRRVIEKWQPRGVVFWLVFVDRDQGADEVRAHVRDYGYPGRVALDRSHRLVELVGATITPEAAVFAPGRRLVYHGRIDDRFADLGVARAQPTTHELEDALTAVLDGRPPAVVHVAAIGCLIDDLR